MYLDIANRIGQQSYAVRFKVGALLVKDNNILSFGYNGTPHGRDNTCEFNVGGTLLTKKEVLHAESNAIAKVAKSTQSSEGATLYLSLSPCLECAKLIVQSGIKRVVFETKYRDEKPIKFLEECGITVEQMRKQ